MKHMNETFDCTNCHEKFVFKSSLARHMVRSHPGRTQVRCQGVELPSSKGPMSTNAAGSVPKITIKPFQCLDCDKSYKLKGALRAHHEAAHTDSTFDCGGCNEKLPYVSSLAYHLAMFSGRRLPKAWPCSSCNKAYDKFCWYNRHFLAVHAKHAYCSGCMEVELHTTFSACALNHGNFRREGEGSFSHASCVRFTVRHPWPFTSTEDGHIWCASLVVINLHSGVV